MQAWMACTRNFSFPLLHVSDFGFLPTFVPPPISHLSKKKSFHLYKTGKIVSSHSQANTQETWRQSSDFWAKIQRRKHSLPLSSTNRKSSQDWALNNAKLGEEKRKRKEGTFFPSRWWDFLPHISRSHFFSSLTPKTRFWATQRIDGGPPFSLASGVWGYHKIVWPSGRAGRPNRLSSKERKQWKEMSITSFLLSPSQECVWKGVLRELGPSPFLRRIVRGLSVKKKGGK